MMRVTFVGVGARSVLHVGPGGLVSGHPGHSEHFETGPLGRPQRAPPWGTIRVEFYSFFTFQVLKVYSDMPL